MVDATSPKDSPTRARNASGKENIHRTAGVSLGSVDERSERLVQKTNDDYHSFDVNVDDDRSDGGRSEGGDDFHCTQIIESQDSIDNEEAKKGIDFLSNLSEPVVACPSKIREEGTEESNNGPTHQKQEPKNIKSALTSRGDICFICGADLSKLKRRIDHIKRCSKKHGITGRDVRIVNENASKESPSENRKGNSDAERAPGEETNWHGDAGELLKLTNQDHCLVLPNMKSTGAIAAPTKPSPWTASGYDAKSGKFVPPSATRNLNNVLMAGSKAAGRRDEIAGQSKGQKRSRYNNARRENWNCPMYKKITGTDFVVDGFHYAKQSLTKNYFLTHFHSDHYGGISSSWDVGTIFCSLPTASLVTQQLRVDRKHLHPLPMNTPTVLESRGKAVTVTLLDANHCPGAVMFLFEVGKRTILHVGDFRWSRDAMLQDASSPLQKIASDKMALDELYLDTTYCNEKYQLPAQSDTIKATIETFEKELVRCRKVNPPKRTLHLFGAYTIGKEKIYLSVAEYFGLKIYVDSGRHRILSTLNLPEKYMKLLTTNKETSDIWVVPMGHLNMKKLPDYFGIANSKPFAPAYDRIVGYRPTGWSLSRSGIISSRNSGKLAIHSVPYSEHSSFPELVDCLACLRPAKIIPTVNASKSNDQVKRLLQGLRNKQMAQKMFSKREQ